jgi:putative spermidine/putrescine transport system permease protein
MSAPAALARPGPATRPQRRGFAALGLVPFGAIVVAFLVLPALSLLWGSIHDSTTGALTLANFSFLGSANALKPFENSIVLAIASSIFGGAAGLLIASAVVSSRNPFIHDMSVTFSSVAANFAGVPLAFAFISTLGANGLLTNFLKDHGVDIYAGGFTIYGMAGLTVVYAYWQIPLMVLVILPSLQALKPAWREAAEILGASRWYYLRTVVIPVLTPPVLASVLLLFANSFGAFATAYALTTGFVSLVPIAISNLIAGDITFNPGQGDALAVGLGAIMAICIIGRVLLERRTSRWLRR